MGEQGLLGSSTYFFLLFSFLIFTKCQVLNLRVDGHVTLSCKEPIYYSSQPPSFNILVWVFEPKFYLFFCFFFVACTASPCCQGSDIWMCEHQPERQTWMVLWSFTQWTSPCYWVSWWQKSAWVFDMLWYVTHRAGRGWAVEEGGREGGVGWERVCLKRGWGGGCYIPI